MFHTLLRHKGLLPASGVLWRSPLPKAGTDTRIRTLRRATSRGLGGLLQSRFFVVGCLGVALIVRVGWILLVAPKPVSDFDSYFTGGVEISLGHGYQMHGAPTAFWPVGYPAFLGAVFALFGSSLFVAKLANALLYVGIIALSYWVAASLFRSSLTAKLTMLILTFYPNHIAYTSLLASEILFLFFLLMGTALLLRANERFLMIIFSGAIFGLACLVRPQAIFLPIVLVLLTPKSKRTEKNAWSKLLSLAGVYAALVLVLLPWTMRNYKAFGHVVLVSTNGGGNLLIGNNPWADGAYVSRPEFSTIVDGGNEYEQDQRAGKFAIAYMREHPASVLKLWPRKLRYLYGGDIEGIRWNVEGLKARGREVPAGLLASAIAVSEAYYLLLGATCIASFFLFLRRTRRPGGDIGHFPIMGLGIVGYFTLLSMVFFGGSRFHFPAMPWIVMYGAALPAALAARGTWLIDRRPGGFHR